MITEDYVSFEIAKLLKEKGFNEECEYFYDYYEENDEYVVCSTGGSCNREDYPSEYSMPTLQMAMKWLRKVHNCPIEILWHFDANSQCSEWYFVHHMELKPLPQIQYYDTYEEAAEAAIKYCLENLI